MDDPNLYASVLEVERSELLFSLEYVAPGMIVYEISNLAQGDLPFPGGRDAATAPLSMHGRPRQACALCDP